VYRLSNEPSLRFETWIKLKDDFALFNPTSHMYFNFSDANILNHQILSSITHVAKQIHSTSTLEREEFLLFNEANKASLNDILSYFSYSGKGDLDHTFFFDANDRKIRLTNQKMEMIVRTSYPCVRIYCASNGFSFPLENITDSSKKHLGVTLECQYLDNDIQLRGIESQMLVRKGENRHEFIEYIFLPRNLSSFSV
jgi:galactose mutarotase-like enzyme